MLVDKHEKTMLGLSRPVCIWICVIHSVVVMPSFLFIEGGELGPAWIWALLMFDTPLAFLLGLALIPTAIELYDVHPWIIAPLVAVLGPLYWTAVVAMIRKIVAHLNQTGLDAIDERIRRRRSQHQ